MKGKLLVFGLYGAGIVAVLAIGWATILSQEGDEAPTSTSSPSIIPAAPLPPLPSTHPALTTPLTTLEGAPITLQRWGRGTAVVLLWASWCEGCGAWLKEIARLSEQLERRGTAFIAVNRAEAPEDVGREKARVGGNLAFLLDPSDTLFGAFEGEGMPLLIVLHEGQEMGRFSGPAPFPRAELQRLLFAKTDNENTTLPSDTGSSAALPGR